jgi:hypothetical protein
MKTATSHVIVLLLGVGLGVLVVHPRSAPTRSDVEPRRPEAQPDARPLLVAAAAIPDSEGTTAPPSAVRGGRVRHSRFKSWWSSLRRRT